MTFTFKKNFAQQNKHLFLDWIQDEGGLFVGGAYSKPHNEKPVYIFDVPRHDCLIEALGDIAYAMFLKDAGSSGRLETEDDIRERLSADYERRMTEDPSTIPDLTDPIWLNTQLQAELEAQRKLKDSLLPKHFVIALSRPVSGISCVLSEGEMSLWHNDNTLPRKGQEIWTKLEKKAKEENVKLVLIEHLQGSPLQKELAEGLLSLKKSVYNAGLEGLRYI